MSNLELLHRYHDALRTGDPDRQIREGLEPIVVKWAIDRIAELKAENERLYGEQYGMADWVQMGKDANALLDEVAPIAEEMMRPECPAGEVEDCETCQSFIAWGKRIDDILKKRKESK